MLIQECWQPLVEEELHSLMSTQRTTLDIDCYGIAMLACLTITRAPITSKGVSSAAPACVVANDVHTGLTASACSQSTLVNICKVDKS